MLYSLSGITKVFGTRTVLDLDYLEIPEGKVTALLGPNGAGKTTLLSILAFLAFPTQGSMEYASKKVRFAESGVQPLRREVVLINQHPIMFSRSVYKNMEFGLKLRKIPKDERRRIIEESLAMVGLEHFSAAKAHKLSGGETQRIALARALALSPKVILCDEPLASVDAQNQAVIVSLLKKINRDRGISIIFTSHDSMWAKNLSDQVIYLDHGTPVDVVLENIFSGMIEREDSGGMVFRMNDGPGIPLTGASPGQARISLDPHSLKITTPDSARGEASIMARVTQMSQEQGGVRVVVDLGFPCTVLLTREQYQGLNPRIGDQVGVHIPPQSISILNG